MVLSPSWEANWFPASQEIPRISRNPKVHYRTRKRTPPVSILGQPNPVHMPTFHLLEIHPNIIQSSTPRSPQWPAPVYADVYSKFILPWEFTYTLWLSHSQDEHVQLTETITLSAIGEWFWKVL